MDVKFHGLEDNTKISLPTREDFGNCSNHCLRGSRSSLECDSYTEVAIFSLSHDMDTTEYSHRVSLLKEIQQQLIIHQRISPIHPSSPLLSTSVAPAAQRQDPDIHSRTIRLPSPYPPLPWWPSAGTTSHT